MKEKLLKAIGITSLEFQRVKLAWTLRFLYQIGFVVAWTITIALFLEQFGIDNFAYFFLLDGLLLLIGTFVAGMIINRCKLRYYILSGIVLCLICLYLAKIYSDSTLYFFAFIFLAKDFFFAQVSIALYRQNEEFFSPTEAKTVVPVIESAITIGGVVSAFLLIQGLNTFSEVAVLNIWGGVLLIMAYLVWNSKKIIGAVPEISKYQRKSSERIASIPMAFKKLHEVKFLKYIGVVVAIQAVLFTVVEYRFTLEVQSHIQHDEKHETHEFDHDASVDASHLQVSLLEKSKGVANHTKKLATKTLEKTKDKVQEISAQARMHNTLAHDLGVFHLFISLLALVVQLLITGRVLDRIGIVGSMTSYYLSVALMFVLHGFANVNIGYVRAAQHGFHSLFEAPYHISYYSIKHQVRESIRLVIEGIIKPLGVIIGALMLLYLPVDMITIVVLALMTLLILLHGLKKKSFTKLCYKNVKLSDKIIDKLHAIETLSYKGHQNIIDSLARELMNRKENELVRRKIIDVCSKIRNPDIIHAYIRILKNPHECIEIKVEILKSILQIPRVTEHWQTHAFSLYNFVKTLRSLLDTEENQHLRKLIIMNLFRHLPVHEVVPFFLETIKDADEELQMIYLRSSRIINDPEITEYIEEYLENNNPKVRGHAIIALWDYGEKEELKAKVHEWLVSGGKEDIIAGIYAVGEVEAHEFKINIEAFMDHEDVYIRIHSLIALAKLGESHVRIPLQEVIFGKDQGLANMVYHMLERIPDQFREKIYSEIHFQVAKKISTIIDDQKINQEQDFSKLSVGVWQKLIFLYSLAGRYDCIIELDEQLKVH